MPSSAPRADPPGDSGLVPVGRTERARVVRVVDGDTIVVDRGLGDEKVRYIGIDTPESVKPNTPVEFMAREASAANASLVEGREVLLELDVSETDRYDRLLRYVWLADSGAPSGLVMVNLALVAQGFAQVFTYPPDVQWTDVLLAAQREAREQGLGLWSAEAPALDSVPDVRPGGAGSGGTRACDPSYPDVCIPPGPPDLDCADVPFDNFTALVPDPHRFDGNGDGVACEGP